MKSILKTALALTLLSSTAVVAQPDTQFRISQNDNGQNDNRDWQDNNRQDRRDRNAADKKAADQTSVDEKAADLKAAQEKAAEKAATDRRTNDRAPADRKVNAQRAKDQMNRGQRAVDQRANDKAINEQRVNDQRKADQKVIEQRTNDRNRAEQTWQEQNRQDQMRQDRNRQEQMRQDQNRNDARDAQDRRDNAAQRADSRRWSRGDRLPDRYRQDSYYVNDWRHYGLKRPPRGYRWVRDDNYNFFLAAIATGLIANAIYRDDRELRWNRRYSRMYSYNDDVYYRECRNGPDPAGVIAGAIIGGLLGHTASGGRTGATVAGVVAGGAIGAALTSNLDCEDQSYAYRTYYEGFNSGRPDSRYEWRNPRNDHRGVLRVGRYYNDPYGFRCANFIQDSYVQGHSYKVRGRACRQPDGTWAIVN